MSGSCKHQKRCGPLLLRLLYIFQNKIYIKKKIIKNKKYYHIEIMISATEILGELRVPTSKVPDSVYLS